MALSNEPRGGNCTSGGVRIDVGLDNGDGGGTAGDRVLQSGEIDQTRYVCNADAPIFNASAVSSSTTVPVGGGIAMNVAWDGANYWLASHTGVWTMNPQTFVQTSVPLAGSPSPRSVFTKGDGTSSVYLWFAGDAALYDVNASGFSATGGSLQNGANDFQLCWDDVSSKYVGRADDTFYHWNASGVELPTTSAQPAIPAASWNFGAAMYRGRFIVYNHATNSLDAYSRTGALTESVVLSDRNVESYGISVANHKVWVSFASEWRAYDVLR
jgi:hypothetical protein